MPLRPEDSELLIELVLFDLGGVLVELRGVASMAHLSGITDEDELWRRWLDCRWVRIFESGGCGPEEFSRGVVEDWGLTVEPSEFLDLFARWPTGPMNGAEDLVTEVATRAEVGCLSNTNALHWDDQVEHWPLMSHFDPCFLSHRLGLVKPDREVFERVAESLHVEPFQVLFLDDNLVNVESARSVGFPSQHVRGVEEARRALADRGLATVGAP